MTAGFRTHGLISVLPTIFHDDGALDDLGTQRVIRELVASGVAGLTVAGVMGEAALLTDDERDRLIRLAVEAADGTPIVMGVTAPDADAVASRSRAAAGCGSAAVMVSPTPSLSLGEAVKAAGAGDLPIVVQDYPAASGVRLGLDDFAKETHPLFTAVKAEAPPTTTIIEGIGRSRPDLSCLGGLGGLFLVDELRAGSTGVMTGFALAGRLASVIELFEQDPIAAEDAYCNLLPLMRFEAFVPFSLGARKEVWRQLGIVTSARCRWKGAELTEVAQRDVARALRRVCAGEDALRE